MPVDPRCLECDSYQRTLTQIEARQDMMLEELREMRKLMGEQVALSERQVAMLGRIEKTERDINVLYERERVTMSRLDTVYRALPLLGGILAAVGVLFAVVEKWHL